MKRLSLFIALLCFSLPLFAQETSPDLPLADSAQETQARQLFRELRCEVCEGQTIGDSNAALAADMRALVRSRIAAGSTPEQIKSYLAERYGEGILMSPPVVPRTLPLWLAPLLLLVLGAGMMWRYFRQGAKRDE